MTDRPYWETVDPAWPIHDETVVWETPYFEGGYDTVVRPDGEQADYYWLDCSDAAVVVAITDADEVVLVEQYRPRLRTHALGVPGGGVDDGEDPERAAARELREETGYVAAELTHLETYTPTPWTRYRRHVFVTESVEPGDADPDDGEYVETTTVPASEAVETIREQSGSTNGIAMTPLLLARDAGYL